MDDIEEILAIIRAYNKRLEETIDKSVGCFEESVIEMQKKLLDDYLTSFVGTLEVQNGVILNTTANFARISSIDKVFDRFSETFQKNRLRKFAVDLLDISRLSLEYYKETGFDEKTLSRIQGAVKQVESYIGISNNKLVRGGYLETLGLSNKVRLELKNYVLNSITTKKGYRQFLKGFENLVVGPNKKTDGLLQSYYRQYAYDKFNQVREVANNYAAEEIGLNFFLYEGSLIKTSRAFCEKRAGKVFSIAESKTWKNDPDLIDKKTKESYNPLIERGRYNCRHWINYISRELAVELRPDLKKIRINNLSL